MSYCSNFQLLIAFANMCIKHRIYAYILGVISNIFSIIILAPTQGHLKVRVHDEAYARAHAGIIGFNFDFFVARVCFKGGTEYNINILQVTVFCCWFFLNPNCHNALIQNILLHSYKLHLIFSKLNI